jgi:molecular chaperone GrpE (heat shock protein)
MFEHELAQNKEQYEGYTVFHINVKGSDKPIKMMCLTDVKQIVKISGLLEGKPENLQKLKELEKQLTLIRDDFSGYCNFTERNIRQAKELVAWEDSFKDLLETLNTLDYVTNTEKEADGLRQKIINIVKGVKPNSSHD